MYVIRFRDGRYFKDVNQHEDDFVKLEDARKFEVGQDAENFMRKYFWMAFAGAKVLEIGTQTTQKTQPRWGIEFIDGGYFQGLGIDRSGPAVHAQTFASKEDAEDMLKSHYWLSAKGGMVKEIK